jgi:uncharacterized membrane protein
MLLVVPGFYLALRLQFGAAVIVEENAGVIGALKRSWDITKGCTLQLFVVMLIQLAVVIVGAVALGIGVFVAIPLCMLIYCAVYKRLTSWN